MARQRSCYIKKRLGCCLLNQIQELDYNIFNKKQYYQMIESKIAKIENAIKYRRYEEILLQQLALYDGFNWEDISETQFIPVEVKNCPYRLYDCNHFYRLKKNVLAYHNEQLYKIISEYNQLVYVITAIKNTYKSQTILPNQFMLTLSYKPFLNIGCGIIENTSLYKERLIYYDLFYIENRQRVSRCKVELNIYDEIAMKGTYLSQQEKKVLWLQVKIEKETMEIIQLVMESLYEMIEHMNKMYKKQSVAITGIYTNIDQIALSKRTKLIKELRPLGYKAIGRIKDGIFKEEQILIKLYSSTKKTKYKQYI